VRKTSTLLTHLSLPLVRLALQNGVHLVPTNFAFAGTLVLVVAPTLSRAGISMFAFIVHSPLTKAKPALGLPLGLIPITTSNERFALIVPCMRPPSILQFSTRLRNVP